MIVNLAPKEINIYALIPYAIIPAKYQIDDNRFYCIFGQIIGGGIDKDRLLLRGSNITHYILMYTKIDEQIIDKINQIALQKQWYEVINDFVKAVVNENSDCNTIFLGSSITPNYKNITTLVGDINADITWLPQTYYTLINAFAKYLKTVYTLFFLNYECFYDEQTIILDKDDKLIEIPKYIKANNGELGNTIFDHLTKNGYSIINFISGIPVSTMKRIVKTIKLNKSIPLLSSMNYYQNRNIIILSLYDEYPYNDIPEFIVILIEFVYTRQQIEQIVKTFEDLFMLLTIYTDKLKLSNDTIQLLERYYLHFAIPYYQTNKNSEFVSVVWFFDYMRISKDLNNDYRLSQQLRDQINSFKQIPDRRYRIAELFNFLSFELPPHLIPYLIKDIYSDIIKQRTETYKQLRKLTSISKHAKSLCVPILASDFILYLKQIIVNKNTDQNIMSILQSGLTGEQILRFEILARYLLHKTASSYYISMRKSTDDIENNLLEKYNIKQLTILDNEYVIRSLYTYDARNNLLLELNLNNIKGISIDSTVLFNTSFVKDILPIDTAPDIKIPEIYLNNLKLYGLENERKNISHYFLFQVT